MENNPKYYNGMETVLQMINRDFISMNDNDIKQNNEILGSLVTQITNKMKEKDQLFSEMYSEIFYGGSFYDGLKVGHPDEYDLDLLLKLPSQLKYKLVEASNVPGFVTLKFTDYTPSMQKLDSTGKHKYTGQRKTFSDQGYTSSRSSDQGARPRYYQPREAYAPRRERGMDKLINPKHYLVTSKVSQWMQKVVDLALNTFEKDGSGRSILRTAHGNFYARTSKSGPAYTLKVAGTVQGKTINMDVDLVPCFVLPGEQWPKCGFRQNPVRQKPNFFIVPKPATGMDNSNIYWRLSFQEQERVIMDKKATLKPSIKLSKKMRDFLQHKKIASYYLKTVALWTIDEKDAGFWNNSLSYVFMTILKKYQTYLESGRIPYYWNKNHNLIENLNEQTVTNINNKIKAIINDINRNVENATLIAKYLVSPLDVLKLNTDLNK